MDAHANGSFSWIAGMLYWCIHRICNGRKVRITMTTKLLELIAAPENLLSAWRAVRGNIPKYRRQRASGPDGVSLAEFEQDLTTQIKVLRSMLMKGRYQP